MIDCVVSLMVTVNENQPHSPDLFLNTFGTTPSKYWRKGELAFNGKGPGRSTTTGWRLMSSLSSECEPSDQLAEIISRLDINDTLLLTLRSEIAIEFWVVVRIYEGLDRPRCTFDLEQLSVLSRIGASLAIDIY